LDFSSSSGKEGVDAVIEQIDTHLDVDCSYQCANAGDSACVWSCGDGFSHVKPAKTAAQRFDTAESARKVCCCSTCVNWF
jgi:hypothetical protein